MNEATLKAFILEYAQVHNLDPVDVAMVAGGLIPDFMQSRPECLLFVMELKEKAPTVFATVKLLKDYGENKNDNSK